MAYAYITSASAGPTAASLIVQEGFYPVIVAPDDMGAVMAPTTAELNKPCSTDLEQCRFSGCKLILRTQYRWMVCHYTELAWLQRKRHVAGWR
jgi:hypothetical protein